MYQFASSQGLHDDYRKTLEVGVLQAPASCLRMLIHIVILDLAEVPIPGIHQTAEIFGVAVIGETNLPDCAGFHLFFQPAADAHIQKLLPGVGVVEHVHQVVIDIIGL